MQSLVPVFRSHSVALATSPRPRLAAAAGGLMVAGLVVASLLAVAAPARAEVVLMRSGSRIDCARAVPEGNRMRLELPGGGVLHVALADVKRVESGSAVARGTTQRTGRAAAGYAGSSEPAIAQSSGVRFDPVAAETSTSPVDSEVAYRRAVDSGKASAFPTVVGAMAGVEPVPVAPQLRTPPDQPQMDAARQAYAQRSRLTPGSAGALLGRVTPGSMSGGGGSRSTDGMTGRDAPRVPR